MRRTIENSIRSVVLGTSLLLANSALAQDAYKWWPFDVIDRDTGETISYEPLEKASQKWHICILFPHVKDIAWVSTAYGVMEEARRLGIKATLLDAGGYPNLVKQVAQYDDCVSLGADAIILSVVSEAGLVNKINEGKAKGIPQVGLLNPIADAPVDSKIYVDYGDLAAFEAEFLVNHYMDREEVNVMLFPGPPGAEWANDIEKGFRSAITGSNIRVLDAKYGDTGKATQLPLVEDALQIYDNIDLLFGLPSLSSVAVEAVAEIGREDVDIFSVVIDEQAVRDTAAGNIIGFGTDVPVAQGAIAVDTAVRILEGKQFRRNMAPQTILVTKDSIDSVDLRSSVAPKEWQLVTKVD